MTAPRDPTEMQELTRLVSTSNSTSIYPTEDSILSLLHARFRHDQPYTRLAPSSSTFVIVNPFKHMRNLDDESQREYKARCYDATDDHHGKPPLQAHPYQFAASVYSFMRRRNQAQAVIFQGITGSGKSYAQHLIINQLINLATSPSKPSKVARQVRALQVVLHSFGYAKTAATSSASKHTSYIELHFSQSTGRLAGAKVLAFALDKSRILARLRHEERTFHVFYQLLAGAGIEERESLGLEDASEYSMLAASGTFHLPGGSNGIYGLFGSDDSVAYEELKDAFRALGFKTKTVSAIWAFLIAILTLANVKFLDGWSDGKHAGGLRKEEEDGNAVVANPQTLEKAARMLGVDSNELESALTRRTDYARKEIVSMVLDAKGAEQQRDRICADLYTVLFAFIVESANRKTVPTTPEGQVDGAGTNQIVFLDQPGYQTRAAMGGGSVSSIAGGQGPLVAGALGQNGFCEFISNYQDELVHSFVLRQAFEDGVGRNGRIAADGVAFPAINIMDNSGCVGLLRGGVVDGNEVLSRKPGGLIGMLGKATRDLRHGKVLPGPALDDELTRELGNAFGTSPSFVQNPQQGFGNPFMDSSASSKHMFGINHWVGNVSYDAKDFVERDCDRMEAVLVRMLRHSDDPFVTKLFSGPSLCTETHAKDKSIVVRAQVSLRPLREPTPFGGAPEEIDEALEKDKAYAVTTQVDSILAGLLARLERSNVEVWTVACIRPNDSGSPNSFDKRRVRHQVRALGLVDLVVKRAVEWAGDWSIAEFFDKIGHGSSRNSADDVREWAREVGWGEGVDYALGKEHIWVTWECWKDVEDRARAAEGPAPAPAHEEEYEESSYPDDATTTEGWGHRTISVAHAFGETGDTLYHTGGQPTTPGYGPQFATPTDQRGRSVVGGQGDYWDRDRSGGDSAPPTPRPQEGTVPNAPNGKGYMSLGSATNLTANKSLQKPVEVVPTTATRRWWVRFVWLCTWWIPSFLLSWIGRMKRSDVRMAWREKVTICFLIFGLCGVVIFYVIFFGKLICPEFNKAWSLDELQAHTAENDFWVAVQGKVYDITSFWKGDHGTTQAPVTQDVMKDLAGKDLSVYFPPPIGVACAGLGTNNRMQMRYANATSAPAFPQAVHSSSELSVWTGTELSRDDWYSSIFLKKMNEFYKGPVVWDSLQISNAVNNDKKVLAVYNNNIFDLSDYLQTLADNNGGAGYNFLDDDLVALFKQQPGQDITKSADQVYASMDANKASTTKICLNNLFYVGQTDFRKGARCQIPNYLLLGFSALIALTIVAKFLAALQLTSKRTPELLDKFVICQVPCYTEGEESLRRTIDSLAALKYDDKRKLLFLICDGNIVGSGNDRPTPRIALDILGVDPSLDPEPLMFRSIAEGSKQLNYGKVYSGLYEFEGHVVPYMVVVKVGRPSERQRPGNRGKRDSQILLLHYLNRVHFDAPMYPLELEIYHQMRNVIGIDPAFYEYIFMVDADTTVTPESLNRLVAVTSDDAQVIAVCGETKLDNEEGSWWTMIQVYEYYISHHLAKAFESLFGSVTCLPGCFSMYRIRTADKGRPLIISNRIIEEYSECNVDTLHKKNLLSLGEDRYLTTLMMKHFPTFKMKFTPDAVAHTVAPDRWSILLSQRRRWINSTIHNLCELVSLSELCGFCCFSMRFIVFFDLLGTLILPATAVYLVYLVVTVTTQKAPLPLIAIVMLSAVYGLQAIIFLLKREFMLIGWMVLYLIAYPVYSFFLPLYSFWCMDDFSWGNTRIVVGEGKDKKVIIQDDEGFDESMIPLKKFSEYEAEALEGYEKGSHSGSRTPSPSRPASRAHSRAPPPASSGADGDYYRDTNLTYNNSSNPNLRLPPNQHSASGHSHQAGSVYGGLPQLPQVPFGAGSIAGSDHGGYAATGMGFGMPMMGMPAQSAYAGSLYGGVPGPSFMPGAPRNSVATNLNMFGGSGGGGLMQPPSMAELQQRPMSTFSLATTANPFAGTPSQSTDPTDEELLQVLRIYLSTQDLMTVTKKTAREAVMTRFPKADLSSRKQFLNQSIDQVLSGS